MKTKRFELVMSVFLIAIVVLTLGLSSQSAAAGNSPTGKAQAGGGEPMITSPAKIGAATVPWTAAQMKAAKPYPLAKAETSSEALSSNLALGPTGPAVLYPGAAPSAASAAATADSIVSELSDVTAQGYAYPAPFTRFHVGSIAAYTKYPFSTVGKLFFRQGGIAYVCSASVIGLRGIMTTGDCLHSGNNNVSGWSTNVVFVPAYRNGVAPYGQWVVYYMRIFSDWYARGAYGDMDHDWGAGYIVQLRSGKTIGQTVGYLGTAANYSRLQSWWLLGYPQSAPFNGAYMYACNSSYAYDSPYYSGGPAPMSVGCDLTGGISGGPWILAFGSGNYLNSVSSHRASNRPRELAGPYANSDAISLFTWARR